MNTKKLLSIAILAILPFGANAAYTYNDVNRPALVANNGTVIYTTVPGVYATADIENADSEHIASTAYVKGAYNDTIAAINRIEMQLEQRQGLLADSNGNAVIDMYDLATLEDDLVNLMDESEQPDQHLVSFNGIVWLVNQAKDEVNNNISDKRVTIYTTWEDDSANATTQVELSTAQ